ncbi:alpha/beta fold hydrolase [Corynebacterium mayonis]|uniref:alpha/beta fold hydrolase n=1 Tax=Corynebacterium mayonis TaxID=3062461 RepID=UPI003140354A
MGTTILHAVESGNPEGAPVVLLSSIGTTHAAWDNQLEALRDFRVIALDHLGHGQSPLATTAVDSVAQLADNVLATLDSLGVDRFAVVGLSLGGAIAQYLAATCPRVSRAAICATATFLGGKDRWVQRCGIARDEGMEALADGMVDNWLTPGFRAAEPDVVEHLRRMILGINKEGFAQNGDALATWDFAGRLSEITCPVLTIAGAEDPSTGPEQLAEIAAGVSGEVRSVVISPGSHQVALENPRMFNEALVTFLAPIS